MRTFIHLLASTYQSSWVNKSVCFEKPKHT
jgi:hypothetical protein